MINKTEYISYFDQLASKRAKWIKRNFYYHRLLQKYFRFFIPEGSRVLELGCGTGELLDSLQPSYGLGIDFSPKMLELARAKYPNLSFVEADASDWVGEESFDYIILSDLVGSLIDVQKVFGQLHRLCHENTRIIISYHNYLWEPIFKIGEFLGLKAKQPQQSWLSYGDIKNLLEVEGFQLIRKMSKILLPYRIPLLSWLFNSFLANLPVFNSLCITDFVVAKHFRVQPTPEALSASIIVPARNERGNIENAILQTPRFCEDMEFIFMEGHSSDGTYEEMLRVQEKYKELKIVVAKQSGKGKGNAVRDAFDLATKDVLFILDADLTTPPEDMPKFYDAISTGRCEFVNGCRLVYPMEKQAMQLLNYFANKTFGILFTWLLGQRLKDTLCGTKVLLRSDYIKIKNNRHYFGDFDPFGDFDLLFGASKLNLKMVEIPVRYRDRQYGSTQISRFKHGWLLLKMCVFASKKIKFI